MKETKTVKDDVNSLANELISSLNKEHGSKIAYNLVNDESPIHVSRWISTGSKYLDYIISNRRNGGLPEGRIIEIFGPPGNGKSHIALQIAKSTQKMGGIVVYIDTENGTSIENLRNLGVDISKGFVFVETACTEEVFSVAEKTIMKAKSLKDNVPITIIWDSVAATSPKAELDGDYDKESIGLQARAISKGMRKITQIIGFEKTTFVILNQTRMKIGIMFGDPTTTPGGMAIPFHSSVRIKLGAGAPLKGKDDEIYGIAVSAKTIKNRVSHPFRTANFEIHFGIGIKEHNQLFELIKEFGEVKIDELDKKILIDGNGAWKNMLVTKLSTGEILVDKKFHKHEFNKLMNDSEIGHHIDDALDKILLRTSACNVTPDIDPESYDDVKSLMNDHSEILKDN